MAIQEGVVLNGLNLNPASGNFAVEAIDFTPPPKKPEWAQSVDSDGAGLVRTPLFENRTITATVRIQPQASMNVALEKLGELVDQLQEAEKNPGGIPLEWTPANSTKTITLYVLTGKVTGIPIMVQGEGAGWFALTPQVMIEMTAKPFGYGAEEEVQAAKSNETGLSIVTFTLASIKGDVPAEGRLIVKDTAGGGVGRRFVEWGLENRYYNAATSLVLDSEDMIPVGGLQSTALNASGAYKRAGATKGTIATGLVPEPTICCNTGNLKHVGVFRVKARSMTILGEGSLTENVHLRLRWQDGEGQLHANAWQTPLLGGSFVEVDLGVITVNPAIVGTQKWLGQIEAYSENGVAADTLHIDYLTFVPVLEGYGKARGVLLKGGGVCRAFDNFTTGTLSGNLNSRIAPLPESVKWTTYGETGDFKVAAGNVSRATKDVGGNPRIAVLGPSLTNMRTVVTLKPGKYPESFLGAVARFKNETHYIEFCYNDPTISLVRVAGGKEPLVEGQVPKGLTILSLSVTALSDGSLVGELETTTGTYRITANSALMEASGLGGIVDYSNAANPPSRTYTSLTVTELGAIPYCIQSSRSMQVRSDSAITTDSTGTYYGPVPEYRGSRFFVPQDGSANRTSRIIVKADRNDLEESDQQQIADAFTAQCFVTPRYHVIPR